MEVVVETGAGLSNANSYVSLDAADAYWISRGQLTTWADVPATVTLTLTAQPAANDNVKINSITYTFKSTLTPPATNEVKIGSSLSDTLMNLACAVNQGPGAGTRYSSTVTTDPGFVALRPSDTAIVFKAAEAGIIGNSIEVVASLTTPFDGFSSDTFIGGKDSRAQGLVEATLVIDAYLRDRVNGRVKTSDQALVLPRYDMTDSEGQTVDDSFIPSVVLNVQCELALLAQSAPLVTPEVTSGRVKRERSKVGTLEEEIEYAGSKPGSDQRDLSGALKPLNKLLTAPGSGAVVYFERS